MKKPYKDWLMATGKWLFYWASVIGLGLQVYQVSYALSKGAGNYIFVIPYTRYGEIIFEFILYVGFFLFSLVFGFYDFYKYWKGLRLGEEENETE